MSSGPRFAGYFTAASGRLVLTLGNSGYEALFEQGAYDSEHQGLYRTLYPIGQYPAGCWITEAEAKACAETVRGLTFRQILDKALHRKPDGPPEPVLYGIRCDPGMGTLRAYFRYENGQLVQTTREEALDHEVKHLRAGMESLEAQLKAEDALIASLREKLDAQKRHIADLDRAYGRTRQELHAIKAEAASLKGSLAESQSEAAELKRRLEISNGADTRQLEAAYGEIAKLNGEMERRRLEVLSWVTNDYQSAHHRVEELKRLRG